ncbi:S-methyl-5-thioribose-1-phosphate isomerase [Dehalogenimonas alkenigignens]|uniref:Methylthioribose-1-phosphate isomerase n=1 Tax=Dehalogenimonas alkenigignens TaxID=1217799 RepID=A0A0W0GFX1_9CHLR|nr:S-methyl-5-thioribose-1-phosphate isomerase [Dehalogenimonas alkenigignens]KTB47443.1 methylthioribose-1-phosphate isomerase [Dehalogenimonas alkenigignens]PVV83495.1 S-methyl-5-thioribose-1-phosphate isomerase [Dehalogenimonas alkenigignens]
MTAIRPVEWLGDRLMIIDQTRLPQHEVYLELADVHQVAEAIRSLKVRGAPAIGVAAAYGIALGAQQIETRDPEKFRREYQSVSAEIAATRPTARNLFMAVERLAAAVGKAGGVIEAKEAVVDEAEKIHSEEIEATRKIAEFGAALVKDGDTILTHCNTGPLATTGRGTALGVIIEAYRQGKRIEVLATETRPLCQGARLTAWELKREKVPFRLITDSMAGHFLKESRADLVVVGADRIARNGDAANKIGTYSIAVLARENGVPFYIAAPSSTFDERIATGAEIVIEERSADEVTHLYGKRTAPEGIEVCNPAFDVTPARYITGFITEQGVTAPPLKI